MRKKHHSYVSFGTVFMIIFTMIVAVSCGALLKYMSKDTRGQFTADNLINTWENSPVETPKPTNLPSPQGTIKTTTVTIAPGQVIAASKIENNAATAKPHDISTFTMTLGGKIAFESDITDAAVGSDKTADYTPVFQELSHSVYSDLNAVTLSSLITAENGHYSDIHTDENALSAIKSLGMNYVFLNHENILAEGEEGLLKTAQSVEKNGLQFGGVMNTDTNGNVRFLMVNGIKIAVLGYIDNVSGKTKDMMAKSQNVSLLNTDKAREDIQSARNQGAQFIIVSLSWKSANTEKITKNQRKTAEMLSAAGADLIIGTGPDGVFPIEKIQTVDHTGNTRQTLVIYSMGTLLSECRDSRKVVSGMLLHLKVNVNLTLSQASFESISYTPTYIWKQESDGNTIIRVLPSIKGAPDHMIQKQKEIMGRALTHINDIMKNSPAFLRAE